MNSNIINGKVALISGISFAISWFIYQRSKLAKRPPKCKKNRHIVKFGKVEGENRGGDPMNECVEKNDPYFWLRDDKRCDREVLEHLHKENAYASKMCKHTRNMRESIYSELRSHVKEDDQEVPYEKSDGKFYFSKNVEGLAYKIYCRSSDSEGKKDVEILLDMNEESKGFDHCSEHSVQTSQCGNILAYSIDYSGNEIYDISIRNLKQENNHIQISDLVKGCDGSIQLGGSMDTIFYLGLDENHRPDKLCVHHVGTNQSEDEVLFEETDGLFSLSLYKSTSGRFLFIEVCSTETSEVHYIDLESINSNDKKIVLTCIEKRSFGVRYEDFDHSGDYFFFRSNYNSADNFAAMYTAIKSTSESHWKQLLPYSPEIYVEGIETFDNYLAISGREGGYSQIWIVENINNIFVLNNGKMVSHRVEFPEEAHYVYTSRNYKFSTSTLRVCYESLTQPKITYQYNMKTRSLDILCEEQIPNYDRDAYESCRLTAVASDGTHIPMSAVYRKDLRGGRPSPTKGSDVGVFSKGPVLMYGYGSYGISIDPDFRIRRLPLLDRGMVFIIAHIRGGGELGYHTWYQSKGKYLHKRNTFTDFITCGRHIIDNGFTSADQLVIEGRSAGGLLMGAVTNMAPDMMKAVVAGVPFVDVMTTMSDATIPLTVEEWEEWGNPSEEKYYKYMQSYSPIDNVHTCKYPNMLITGGLEDPRVAYWEPAKWAATLRDYSTSENPILCKINLTAGHFSASDRYAWLREQSFDYAFVLDQVGLNDTPPVPYPSNTQ